jgi:hypothetical protein
MTPAFTELPTAKSFSLWFDLAHLPARPVSPAGPTGAALPDMALSVQSDIYFATYVVGETPEQDGGCRSWVSATMDRLEPFSAGCYLGDSDLNVRPDRFMSDAAWDRFGEIRAERDPGELFCGYDCADPAQLNAPAGPAGHPSANHWRGAGRAGPGMVGSAEEAATRRDVTLCGR